MSDEKKELDREEVLAQRFESLETELGRLTSLLTEQASAKVKRRRRFTLRVLLMVIAVSAVSFAWFSSVYRASRRQASAVDVLAQQGVFVDYEMRDSLAINILPGTPESPPRNIAKKLGADFFRSATNVSTQNSVVTMDKQTLLPAVSQLSELKRLRLTRLPLRSADLNQLASLDKLESLDVNRTGMDNGSLSWLANTQIRWLDVSHTMLGDRLLNDLSRCLDLQHLNLERTTVTNAGLQYLYGLKSLRYINLKRCPVSSAAAKKLSDALPGCIIDYEPLAFHASGAINHRAIKNGAARFGTARPMDPRNMTQAMPPADAMQIVYGGNQWNQWSQWSAQPAWPNYSMPVAPTPSAPVFYYPAPQAQYAQPVTVPYISN